ncbi:MAG: hypothetical protein P8144_14980 [Gammaproteobacteria bacterium]
MSRRRRCEPDFSLSRFSLNVLNRHVQRKSNPLRTFTTLVRHVFHAITHVHIHRNYCLGIVAIAGLATPIDQQPINSLERVYQRGVLRVGITTPTDVHSPNVHPSNVVIEILQSFANRLNVGLELKQLDAPLHNWHKHNIDVLASHEPSIMPTRLPIRISNSTPPHFCNRWAIN